jgi:DNA end-binding protein Ku
LEYRAFPDLITVDTHPGEPPPPRAGDHHKMESPMPRNSFWKGYLKLSLVTCPVAMQPAVTDRERVRFHTINQQTGHRIQRRYIDSKTGKPVKDEDQARGYPRSEDEYVVLEEDELDAVALDSTRTIDIQEFVPADDIGWIWYDRPHFLMPDDPVGEEAFSVIREAMRSTDTVGIARLVLYRRERAVMLIPRGKGIVLWTLRYGAEVRDATAYFRDLPEAKPDAEALKLVKRLIESRTADWTPRMVEDPVQNRLLEIIEAKRKGQKKPRKAKTEEPGKTGNVISIIDALKRSIAAESGSRKS